MKKIFTTSIIVLICNFSSAFSMSCDTVEQIGDVTEVILPIATTLMVMNYHDREGAWEWFYVASATQLSVTFLKNVVHVKRPNGGCRSFPSGHTAISFASAGFIHRRYGLEYAWPAYIGAAFVGYSRIRCKAHRLCDVLTGAALGIGFNTLFTSHYCKDLRVYPMAVERGAGIAIEGSF